MKKYNLKNKAVILVILCVFLLTLDSWAHSGRTDSRGGHRDNKNKSGLGSYHYHCGGHPAHLHPNGVCPYSSSSLSSSSKSKSKKTETVPSAVNATSIEINEVIDSLEVGESEVLTTTVFPNNTTNKNIIWKSSDDNIAIISSTGVITAKKTGVVTITASTFNGKSSKIKINIKDKPEVEENITIKTSINKEEIFDKNIVYSDRDDDANNLSGILILGLLGGGGYLGYKEYNKNTKNGF